MTERGKIGTLYIPKGRCRQPGEQRLLVAVLPPGVRVSNSKTEVITRALGGRGYATMFRKDGETYLVLPYRGNMTPSTPQCVESVLNKHLGDKIGLWKHEPAEVAWVQALATPTAQVFRLPLAKRKAA